MELIQSTWWGLLLLMLKGCFFSGTTAAALPDPQNNGYQLRVDVDRDSIRVSYITQDGNRLWLHTDIQDTTALLRLNRALHVNHPEQPQNAFARSFGSFTNGNVPTEVTDRLQRQGARYTIQKTAKESKEQTWTSNE